MDGIKNLLPQHPFSLHAHFCQYHAAGVNPQKRFTFYPAHPCPPKINMLYSRQNQWPPRLQGFCIPDAVPGPDESLKSL